MRRIRVLDGGAVPQHADGRPQFSQCLAGGLAHHPQRFVRLRQVLREQLRGQVRVQADHGEGVGGHVVQVPGDPGPFLGDALRGDVIALGREQREPRLVLVPSTATAPHGVAEEQHGDEHHGRSVQHRVEHSGAAVLGPAQHVGDDQEPGDGKGEPPARRDRRRVQRDPQWNGGRSARVVLDVVNRPQQAGDRERD